jgi:hypothetical protein
MAEDGLPDAFQDKPLDAMYLDAAKEIILPPGLKDGVTNERLLVTPLVEEDVDAIRDVLGFADTPQATIDNYRGVARQIGSTTLHNGLVIADVLPPEGVVADYTATYPSGRTRHISTFKEKPSKASIAAGKYFAEEVIGEINNPAVYDLTDIIALMGSAAKNGGLFDHLLTFRKVPNLPLNGHESKSFLNAYANTMFEKAMYTSDRLERMRSLGTPEIIIESAQNIYDQAITSYERAQALLDKK